MRMKKLMILAAFAATAISCVKTYVDEPEAQTPIGFGTWTEQLTKAESRVQGTGTFLSGDTFNVYGYKTVSATPTNVFTGDVVTAKGASEEDGLTVTSWAYSPLRFWDATASSYTFFAVSPSGKVATAPTEEGTGEYTGLFVSTPISFGGHDNDVLVATKKVVSANVGTPKYSSNAVEIQFNHVAALVDVKVKKDAALPASATLKITGASLTGVQNKGTFTVSSYDGNNKPVIGSTAYGWVVDGTSAATTYSANAVLPLTVNGATTEYNGETHVGATTGTAQDLLSNFVLMPQDLSEGAQKLHLEYKIVTQEAATEPEVIPEIATNFTADVDIKDFVVTDKNNNDADAASTSWNPATHYTYTVTIGANAITFTASINNWANVSGYRYLIN